jgi:hypothetical protein
VSGSIKEISSSTDSRRCRRENAYRALVETDPLKLPALCSDTGPAPAHCGADRCTTYCTLANNGCSTLFTQQFGANGIAACVSDCRLKLPDQGQNSIYTLAEAGKRGQVLSCRALRAARAVGALAIDQAIPVGTCEAALGLPSAGGGPTECQ